MDPAVAQPLYETQQEFRCVTTADQEPDGVAEMGYHIELPDYIDADDLVRRRVMGEEITLTITKAIKRRARDTEQDVIRLTHNSVVTFTSSPTRSRRLGTQSFTGTSNVLVLRISARDSYVSLSSAELSNRFFGTNGDQVTLKSMMNQCSMGKKTFVPATGNQVVNGVLDVYIDMYVSGAARDSLTNIVTQNAEAILGVDINTYDHVAYCQPKDVATGWIGYGESIPSCLFHQQKSSQRNCCLVRRCD